LERGAEESWANGVFYRRKESGSLSDAWRRTAERKEDNMGKAFVKSTPTKEEGREGEEIQAK